MKRFYALLALFSVLAMSMFANTAKEKENFKNSGIKLKNASTLMMKSTSNGINLNDGAYVMNFEQEEDLSGWIYYDANADSTTWYINEGYGLNNSQCLLYRWHTTNAANDWIFSPGFALETGKEYEVSFYYHTGGFTEKLKFYQNSEQSTSNTTLINDFGSISNTDSMKYVYSFTSTSDETRYFAWYCHSDADQFYIAIDSVVVKSSQAASSITGLIADYQFENTYDNAVTNSPVVQNPVLPGNLISNGELHLSRSSSSAISYDFDTRHLNNLTITAETKYYTGGNYSLSGIMLQDGKDQVRLSHNKYNNSGNNTSGIYDNRNTVHILNETYDANGTQTGYQVSPQKLENSFGTWLKEIFYIDFENQQAAYVRTNLSTQTHDTITLTDITISPSENSKLIFTIWDWSYTTTLDLKYFEAYANQNLAFDYSIPDTSSNSGDNDDDTQTPEEKATWTHYTTSNTGSNNIINNDIHCSLQDSDGNLWIGTDKGVTCFDGTNYKSYDERDVYGLMDVKDIFEDNSGKIWLAAGYQSVFTIEDGTITKYDSNDGLSGYIYEIEQDANNNLYFVIYNAIYTFDGTSFSKMTALPEGLGYDIEFDDQGNMWAINYENGITKYNMTSGTATNYTQNNGLYRNEISKIELNGNDLWCNYSWGYGLTKFDGSTFTHYRESADGIISDYIKDIKTDDAGNVWFASSKGLMKYDGSSFTNIPADNMSDDFINHIFVKNTNQIYASTKDGLNMYDGSSFNVLSTKDGLVDNYIKAIGQDKDGQMYFGTYEFGLSIYDGQNWSWQGEASENIPDDNIYCFFKDSKDIMWIGTYDGLVKYDGTTWTTYTENDGLAGDLVRGIAEDAAGNIWLACNSNGISQYKDQVFTNHQTSTSGIYYNSIATVGNKVYVGTNDDGLYYYDGSTWSTYTTDNSTLVDNEVEDVFSDSQGKLWINHDYSSKITSFDGTTFSIYTSSEGVKYASYNNFTEDKDGNIWVGAGSDGAGKFDGNEWVYYTTDSGLVYDYVYSIYCDDDGALWMGTYYGLSKYETGSSAGDTTIVNPSIKANFEASTSTSGTAPLEVSFTSLSTGTITDFTWDYGDGNSESTDFMGVATHTYTTPGTYDVKLVVSNGAEKDSVTIAAYITVLPAGTSTTETENNDSYTSANTMLINSTLYASLGTTTGDNTDREDWYKITTPHDGALTIAIAPESSLNTYPDLYFDNGSSYISSCSVCGDYGKADSIKVTDLKAGTYYVKVSQSGEGDYTITSGFEATSLPNGNDAETNDTYLDALALDFTEEKTGHLGYRDIDGWDNEDWYTVTTPYDGELSIVIAPDATLNAYIDLYFSDGSSYISSCTYCGSYDENDTIKVSDLKAGTYYIKATRSGYGSYTISSSFAATSLPDGNDIETNDTYLEALSLDFDVEKTGHLGYRDIDGWDNEDWFTVATPYDGELSIVIAPDATLNAYIDLYFSDGSSYISSCTYCGSYGENDTIKVSDLKAGTYYIKASRSGYGSYAISSSFSATTLPEGNDAEPNNTSSEAITINVGETKTGHIGYRDVNGWDNEDWYAINISSAGKYYIAAEPDANSNIYIDLYASDGSSYISSCTYCGSYGEVDSLVRDLDAGQYYLKVSRSGFGSYTLSLSNKASTPVLAAAFSADVTTGEAPLTVQFTDASVGATTWKWDFDNNGTVDSELQSPSHTYTEAGTYSVKLVVGDGTNTDEKVMTDYIVIEEGGTVMSLPFEENFEYDDKVLPSYFTQINENHNDYKFEISSIVDIEGNYSCAVYSGGYAAENWFILPKLAFPEGREIHFSFSARKWQSGYTSYTENFEIMVSTSGTEKSDFIAVSELTSVASSYYSTDYEFDLSSYANNNCYIAIKHSTDNGSRLGIDKIKVEASIVAAFGADIVSGEAPLSVQFSDSTFGATEWQWDFDNDGTVDAETKDPSYTFTEAGSYTVKLTAGDGNTSDEEIKIGYINVTTSLPNGWNKITSGTDANLGDLSFPSENVGYASGTDGTILKTINGGQTWAILNTGVSYDFYDIDFYDENHGWAVGSGGIILFTEDGGASWSRQYGSGSMTAGIYGVEALGENKAHACGYDGLIMKRSTLGWPWNQKGSSTLRSIEFANENIGWTTGNGGAMYKTTDGGTSWTAQSLGTSSPIYELHVFDANKVIAFESGGKVFKTTDGGNSWTELCDSRAYTSSGIHFIDENYGWLVYYKYALFTKDGGSSWTEHALDNEETLKDIKIVNTNTVCAVGEKGTIFLFKGDPETSGINQQLISSITLYPNPANNSFTIESEARICAVEVLDMKGSRVLLQNTLGMPSAEINISHLNSGLYIVKVETNQGIQIKQLSIK